MADTTPATPASATPAVGHLSVHVDGAHPVDVPFLFEQQEKRIAPAFLASLAYHVVMIVLVFFAIRYSAQMATTSPFLPVQAPSGIIWLHEEGPGGGGGGGGNQMKEPPRQAQEIGRDKITVPVAKKPPVMEPPKQAKNEPNPIEQMNIPAQTLAAATQSLPGTIEAPPGPPTASQGSGKGGGAGTGTGTGIGPGTGSGLGPGEGGGFGGGVYQPGSGVTDPQLVRQVKPEYTPDAMRARIQGAATVECVVKTDGVPADCHIFRSLDSTFGLDQEAIKAAQKWRFLPGKLHGSPVNVQILIEMSFTLR
ncbi:MAG TPA: TonB family protein [Vicinamibacterales bacterium]|nr:TonB family protein [Vicinamibacterales bacterium]